MTFVDPPARGDLVHAHTTGDGVAETIANSTASTTFCES